MSLAIYNNTSDAKTYLSGTISLPASSSVTVPASKRYAIANDGALRTDLIAGAVYLNDGGAINYGSTDGTQFLDDILLQNTTISGATDLTQIGNVGDRLKVDAVIANA